MKTYFITVSYVDNGRSRIFKCFVPMFAADEESLRGYAYRRFSHDIKLPFSTITSIEISE